MLKRMSRRRIEYVYALQCCISFDRFCFTAIHTAEGVSLQGRMITNHHDVYVKLHFMLLYSLSHRIITGYTIYREKYIVYKCIHNLNT